MILTGFQSLPDADITSYKFTFQQVNPTPMNFTSVTNSQDFTLFGMPTNYAVCAVKITPVIAFTAPSLATFTVEIGVSATPAYYAPQFSLMATNNIQLTTPLLQYSTAAHDVVARFISTGASINAITAGQVELTIQIRPLP